MMPKIMPVNFDRVVVYDGQGAGRCWIGAVMLEDRLKKLGIGVPVIPVGLNDPVSGATTMNRDVATMLNSRGYAINPDKSFINKLDKKLLTKNTLAIGLTDETPPDFLPETVLELFVENKADPFPGTEVGPDFQNNLSRIMKQIYYDMWYIERVVIDKPELIGEMRGKYGFVVPRQLPIISPELNAEIADFDLVWDDSRHIIRRRKTYEEESNRYREIDSHKFHEEEPTYRRH